MRTHAPANVDIAEVLPSVAHAYALSQIHYIVTTREHSRIADITVIRSNVHRYTCRSTECDPLPAAHAISEAPQRCEGHTGARLQPLAVEEEHDTASPGNKMAA